MNRKVMNLFKRLIQSPKRHTLGHIVDRVSNGKGDTREKDDGDDETIKIWECYHEVSKLTNPVY